MLVLIFATGEPCYGADFAALGAPQSFEDFLIKAKKRHPKRLLQILRKARRDQAARGIQLTFFDRDSWCACPRHCRSTAALFSVSPA